MYNNHPCVAVDPYQLAYEHCKQPQWALHLGESAEAPLYKLEHGQYQMSDGEKELFKATRIADMEFGNRIADIFIEDPSSFRDSALNFSLAAKRNHGTEALENGKRPSHSFCAELANKRAKKEDQMEKLGQFEGDSPATKLCLPGTTCNMIEVDMRQVQPAGMSFFSGYEYLYRAGLEQLEDVHSPLWEHSHRRCVPIGLCHQADLPQWTPLDFKGLESQPGFYTAHSALSNVAPSLTAIESNEVGDDKWLGTRLIPMPRLHSMPVEVQGCCSEEDCDCTDEGSIRCVRQHVMEAREKLKGALGKKKFIELGFPDMGEDVALRWTEEEESLFHMIVLSNSASLGRNFWTVLPRNFPSRSLKEIVSYYFNVFILRRRAGQNRMDALNADSDNDEWQESSDVEFETSEEEEDEEEDSAVESPADGNSLVLNDDDSEELDSDDETDDEEREKHPVGTEDGGGFYRGSGGTTGYKPSPPCRQQPIDGNSRDCSSDQDVQDDSCTSFEGPCNVPHSGPERDQENLHMEHRNHCMAGLADYEYIDGHHDSKPWEINYIGANDQKFDFFPTCNVIEEVFGEGMKGE